MALNFLTSSELFLEVVITCDTSIKATDKERSAYLSSGDLDDLGEIGVDATKFKLKALSPAEREEAEVKAGAYTRSELGRLLWVEAPSKTKERARWHHALTDDERQAMSDYQAYLSRVYTEMVRSSLTHISGEPASVDQINLIRPDGHRLIVMAELVAHIQRISLLGTEGKQRLRLQCGLVTQVVALGRVNSAKLNKDLDD